MIKCISHAFAFSDGSQVTWHPIDDSGKAHGLFRVDFQLKAPEGGIGISQEHLGPASAVQSLHLLKRILKDQKARSIRTGLLHILSSYQ